MFARISSLNLCSCFRVILLFQNEDKRFKIQQLTRWCRFTNKIWRRKGPTVCERVIHLFRNL